MAASIDTTGFVLPLCTVDEVIAELADTMRSLLRFTEFRMGLDEEKAAIHRETLLHWKSRLEWQRDRMLEQGCEASA